MNSAVIFFVPAGAAQTDFEVVLREHFASVETGEARVQTKPAEIEQDSADELPLWTWFVPNPLPRPASYENSNAQAPLQQPSLLRVLFSPSRHTVAGG
jgi:hypothetical protein